MVLSVEQTNLLSDVREILEIWVIEQCTSFILQFTVTFVDNLQCHQPHGRDPIATVVVDPDNLIDYIHNTAYPVEGQLIINAKDTRFIKVMFD